ncbi:MAG: TRZ/ATZ family hydrolase [Gammaproteobacteria bacterium]|nr:MAG: TRZ/ATZ family hydrolase [Gammaproteobacteria bacterium]
MDADTLIHARWIIPVEPAGKRLEHHALAITDGRILALLPSEEARQQIEATEVVELPGHALIPGLVNAHTHTPMTLFRGLADDLPLMEWLQRHIWPAEQQWVSRDFVAAGSRLAMAEMIRGGTTCFNDMYFFPDVTAQVAHQAGLRAAIGMILIDFPSAWASDSDDYLQRGLALHDQYRNDPLVKVIFAPHAPYSVGDEPLKKVRTLAAELELPVHMHVHETRDEVEQGVASHGLRPLARLDRLGLLAPDLVAVHMTQLEEAEIAKVAEASVQVVHCPQSNLKLASGFCPVAKLLEAGVNVALGTDGAASNNDLDMLAEMQSAALLAKGVSGDPAALPAFQALEMATLNGARALGLEDQTGSLLPGKQADLCAIDLGALETQPVYDPVSQIVYAAGREQVTHLWVKGIPLMRERQLLTLDQPRILADADQWRQRLEAGRQADPGGR